MQISTDERSFVIDRRLSPRTPCSIIGSVASVHGSRSVLVTNASEGGAQLSGRGFPPVGGRVLLRASGAELIGMVAWAAFGMCGVAIVFDEPEAWEF